jgi:hypothetical protein
MSKGDAGRGAWGLLNALHGKQKDYVGGWRSDYIVGSGSKNIPWLNIAIDAVMAVYYQSVAKINAIEKAVNGFLEYSRNAGAFHGEEFSTIYTRWILLPMIVVYFALSRMDRHETARKLRLHIRSIVVLAVVSAGKARRVKHHKDGKGLIHATPYTLFAGSRSWVYGKGDDNKRTLEDDVVWHDASSTLELIDWIIGRNQFQRQGDGWVFNVTEALEKWAKPLILTSASQRASVLTAAEKGKLVAHIDYGFDRGDFNDLLNLWREWPVGPARGDVVIVRSVAGAALTAYTQSYNTGSTSFMQWKDYDPRDEKFFALGVADPRKRSNSEDSTAAVYDKKDGYWYVNTKAKDGTIWIESKDVDLDNLESATAVHGAFEYALYANKEGGLAILYPDGQQEPDDPDDDDDDTFKPPVVDGDRLDQIVDFVYEWLKESGLLAELKKRLIEKALKEMGL